jgi:hypothetical protein
LYPEHKDQVIAKVKQIKEHNDSIDMRKYILQSFVKYSVFDPIIANWDNGYPILNQEKLDLKGSWGDALISEFSKEDFSKTEIIPIQTKAGFLIIFNYEKSKFSVRIEGKNPKQSDQNLSFLIDNRAIELVIVEVTDISYLNNCKTKIDTLIAHKKYELAYLSKMVGEELSISNEEIVKISGTDFLLWSYEIPSKFKVALSTQYLMTTIIGDKIVMFHTASNETEKYGTIKKFLKKFASTIKILDETIDINQIIENVKIK